MFCILMAVALCAPSTVVEVCDESGMAVEGAQVIVQTLDQKPVVIWDDQFKRTDKLGKVDVGLLNPTYPRLVVFTVYNNKQATLVVTSTNGAFPPLVKIVVTLPVEHPSDY